MTNFYNYTWVDVVKHLNSDSYSGLLESQIDLHRKKYGVNEFRFGGKRNIFYLILKEMTQLWFVNIILCSVLFFLDKEVIYFSILIFISLIYLVSIIYVESKELKNINTLEKLSVTGSRVLRGSLTKNISSIDLVVGDIVRLKPGDIVPADIRIIESERLRVNEAVITGENYVVEKYSTKIEDQEISTSEMKNILFKSSTIISGEVLGIVIAVGENTEAFNIISKSSEDGEEKFSLKDRITKIANKISLIFLILTILAASVNYVMGNNIQTIVRNSSILILSYIPITLILIVIFSLFIIIKKMKKEGIVFKNISVIEKFAKASIVFINKTGALSQKTMSVKKIYTNGKFIPLNEETIKIDREFKEDLNVIRLLQIGVLCNDTDFKIGEIKNIKNDYAEIALTEFAMRNGINKNSLEEENNRVFPIPYDTDKRIMTTINRVDGNYRANIKGSLESILSKCTHIMKNGIEMEISEEDINNIKMADMEMSKDSLSVLGFAYRSFNYEPSIKENVESNLVFAGIIGFDNPLKDNWEEAINLSRYLCVYPIIITEDNKLTAYYTGVKLGILRKVSQVISGVEMDNMKEEEIKDNIDKIKIFSRVNYKHKIKMVNNYKNKGYITVMEGAKVNDLPSLKSADVGITDSNNNLLQKFSDIVLKDWSLKNLLMSIVDCRKILQASKNIIMYIVTVLLSTFLFSIVISSFYYSPELKFYIIWINSITVLISSLAIMFQYKEEDYSINNIKEEGGLIKENSWKVISTALIIGIISFLNFKFCYTYSKETAGISSFFILNLLVSTSIYIFSKKFIFKNKVSNMLIIINIFLPIIISAILDYSILFKIFNLQYLKIFLGTIAVWFITILFNNSVKKLS
ncbi:cation-transporting P-type ATPase [Clostridium sporogenes]|uniref:Cation-transporting P-type ATPase n=1 Tax=Clostridium botulinum TaxID=1491 RepID=A0A6M0SYF1_CLOBO|nr:cation-transporting P-type ATPase [Clostridium sporogenes]NFA60536.1 cation-transporting P-type ATPase [Clostridium botulinum]NFI73938.1 cation-transporting P-type ATPase [Clostridium sporogenes]NFL73036.1 cation-transporting P-type ATPase [Clostridium sporogenes]NFM23789.1 cation-transporting P-type ATPase [Clostridium sporogenes]NFP61812.1 cation-transporting P-type ATPase [Clostridium sporogenes]